MFLSLIVPVYKQEKTIRRDLQRILQTLDATPYEYEVIVVIDGRSDKSLERAKEVKHKRLKVFSYPRNQGKGYAIRYGFKKSRGEYIAFIDAGMEIDPQGVIMAVEHLKWYDADIIVGSKRHPVSQVNYPPIRRFLSWGYYMGVRFLFGLKIRDTQAGLKIFKREVIDTILPVLLVKRYAFDIEMLAVAHNFGFTRIYEAPIKLDFKFDSLTSAASFKTVFKMLVDTLAVFYRINILNYYQKQAKKRNEKKSSYT